MKFFLALFFSTISFQIFAQDKIVGHYVDHFGHSITISADRTFKYLYQFDMLFFWTKGTWTLHNDTIFLTAIPIYDTLRYMDGAKINKDSLILAIDEKPQVRSIQITGGTYSEMQDIKDYPHSLLFKTDKIYIIDKTGRLLKKKQKVLRNGKKYRPWFIKIDGTKD